MMISPKSSVCWVLIRPSRMQVFLERDRRIELDDDIVPVPSEPLPAFGTILW